MRFSTVHPKRFAVRERLLEETAGLAAQKQLWTRRNTKLSEGSSDENVPKPEHES
jgi:hypothetical protein